jgi:hypothetical protein
VLIDTRTFSCSSEQGSTKLKGPQEVPLETETLYDIQGD